MTAFQPQISRRQGQRVALAIGVAVLHGGLFVAMSKTATLPRMESSPVIDVELFRTIDPPPPPPPPPSPEPPAPVSGGGAPVAPSRIHTPPVSRPVEPELPAPVVQAPAPALVVGVAPVASPAPGFGQGGQGTGRGNGDGDGDGPGTGGTPPRFIAGPTSRQIADAAPAAARRGRIDGMVALRCVIRLDSRLENCRVVNESPSGMGFGEAAVRIAIDRFRFAPPTRQGRPVSGAQMPLGIQFNLGGRRPDDSPAVG